MRECPYPRSSGVRWDHVDWLWHHPEHINRRAPSREEAIALWKVRTGNRLLLETIDTPTDPPSLAHFDLPKHHRRPSDCYDPEHKWLRHEIASMFAGYMHPPDVHRMREYLVAERLNEYPHPALYELFTCMSPVGLQHLRLSEALTMHELVRALHHSGVRRACLSRVIEPYADPPVRPAYLDVMERDSVASQAALDRSEGA